MLRCCMCLLMATGAAAIDVERPVDAFRHDDVARNAMEALATLHYGWGKNQFEDQLHAALASDDWQQRQLAANVLHRRDAPATLSLVDVTIEGLRHDHSFINPSGANLLLPNAKAGTRYLMTHPEALRDALYPQLNSDDPQQRFLSAVILGHHGSGDAAKRICAICIPHLAHNKLMNDAIYAALGIYGLREDSLPWIDRALSHSTDNQQQEILQALKRRIHGTHTSTKISALSTWQPDPLTITWMREMYWSNFNQLAPQPINWENQLER